MAALNIPADLPLFQAFAYDQLAMPGVYLLILEGEVVYVGQSRNIYKRLGQHMVDGEKRFDSVACHYCTHHDLLTLEMIYITKFAPRYNRAGMGGAKKISERDKRNPIAVEATTGRSVLTPVEAAAFLRVTPAQLRRIPPEILRRRKKRMPRSPKSKLCFDAADLHELRTKHSDVIAALRT